MERSLPGVFHYRNSMIRSLRVAHHPSARNLAGARDVLRRIVGVTTDSFKDSVHFVDKVLRSKRVVIRR